MKTQPILPLLAALGIALLAGCSTPQGVVAPTSQPVQPVQQPLPAPVSRTHPDKEAFQGGAIVQESALTNAFPNARQIALGVGEIVEVYHGGVLPTDGGPQLAFYLPPEATSVVQLVVETKGFAKTYFLKGLAPGETVGGVVQRNWLDATGYRSDNPADEARIQAAIKANPFLILVQ